MKFTSRLALVAALSVAALSAQASLVAQADGTVYDTVLNISWMSNWNQGGGLMTWSQVNDWLAGLNAENYDGHDDWRLPTSNTTASSNCDYNLNPGGGYDQQYYGYDCSGSEMGELFYTEMGATAGYRMLDNNPPELALFTKMQYYAYWTGTVYAPDPSDAWEFSTGNGRQSYQDESNVFYAVAVRPGDDGAAATAVPEPQVLALALLGLGAAAVARRRQRPR